MSMPNVFRSSTVTSPCAPIVAMNANASMTPPNWASTLLAESTSERATPPGRERSIAKQSSGAGDGADDAVTADSQNAPKNEPAIAGSASPVRFDEVNRAVAVEEAAGDGDDRRDGQEHHHVEGERGQPQDGGDTGAASGVGAAQPAGGPARLPPGLRVGDSGGSAVDRGRRGARDGLGHQPTALAQLAFSSVPASVACLSVMTATLSSLPGNSALSSVPAFSIASTRAG